MTDDQQNRTTKMLQIIEGEIWNLRGKKRGYLTGSILLIFNGLNGLKRTKSKKIATKMNLDMFCHQGQFDIHYLNIHIYIRQQNLSTFHHNHHSLKHIH